MLALRECYYEIISSDNSFNRRMCEYKKLKLSYFVNNLIIFIIMAIAG